jgi:hypothetical protein
VKKDSFSVVFERFIPALEPKQIKKIS